MSWASKTEYCNLSIANALVCKTFTEGKTGQYLEKLGRNGAYAATKVFGVRSEPTNTYTIEDTTTITGKNLGDVTLDPTDTSTEQGHVKKAFALKSIKWSTGATPRRRRVLPFRRRLDSGRSRTG